MKLSHLLLMMFSTSGLSYFFGWLLSLAGAQATRAQHRHYDYGRIEYG